MADGLPRQPYCASHGTAGRGRVARHQEVVKVLRATAAAYNAATDDKTRTECGLDQLRAIVNFFQIGNDEVADSFLLQPAHTALNALHDVRRVIELTTPTPRDSRLVAPGQPPAAGRAAFAA